MVGLLYYVLNILSQKPCYVLNRLSQKRNRFLARLAHVRNLWPQARLDLFKHPGDHRCRKFDVSKQGGGVIK